MAPKISIIIPFFNAEKTLPRAVGSILDQEGVDWELVLVNDGSQDGSEQVALSYLGDSRVKLFSHENKGVSAARNLGAKNAKGEWLLFLDADDYFEADAFSTLSNKLNEKTEYNYYQFGYNKVFKNKSFPYLPKEGKYFPRLSGSFVVRKSVFDFLNGFDSRIKFSENTEFFHRIALSGFKGKSFAKIILNYSNNSSGGSKNLKNMINSLTLILVKHDKTLSPHVKHLYHQIIGVNFMRFRNFSQARKHLWQSVEYRPTKLATWGRLSLAFFPVLAKILYSETVNHE